MADETGENGVGAPALFTTFDLYVSTYFLMNGVPCSMSTGTGRVLFSFARTEKFEEVYTLSHDLNTTVPLIRFIEEIKNLRGKMHREKAGKRGQE